jgi:thermitase
MESFMRICWVFLLCAVVWAGNAGTSAFQATVTSNGSHRAGDQAARSTVKDLPDFFPGQIVIKLRDNTDFGEAFDKVVENQVVLKDFASAVRIHGILQKHGFKSLKKVSTRQHAARVSAAVSAEAIRSFCKELRKEESEREASVKTQFRSRMARFSGRGQSVNFENRYKITLSDKKADVQAICAELAADPDIEYATPVTIMRTQFTPNDPRFADQWAHTVTSMTNAWDITQGSSNIIIAVIDVGVDYTHEDLRTKMVGDCNGGCPNGCGYDFVDVDPAALVAEGWTIYPGEDYQNQDNDPMDFLGHGTHCAGIAAGAGNNGIGIAGVALNCRIMPIRAGYCVSDGKDDQGLMDMDHVDEAIRYAVDNGADVISMSFGGSDNSDMALAIQYAYSHGVVLVAGAGNNGSSAPFYPGAHSEVISVAATARDDTKAGYSNYGFWVTIAAPGGDMGRGNVADEIVSTVPKSGGQLTDPSGYMYARGTSMACPYVAGIVGLVLSKNNSWTQSQIRQLLIKSTDAPNSEYYIGAGRINAFKALQIYSMPVATVTISTPANGDVFTTDQITITGTATGTSYSVAYGTGMYPGSWTTIASGSSVTNGTLAQWNTSGINNGLFTLQLQVTGTGGSVYDYKRITIDKLRHAGWPIVLGDKLCSSWTPTFADVNGDGAVETVLDASQVTYAVRHDGSILPGWPTPDRETGGASTTQSNNAAVADIDNDGRMEVVGCYYDLGAPQQCVAAYKDDGTWENGWPVDHNRFAFRLGDWAAPLLADLDGSGFKEILFFSSDNESKNFKVHALRYDGADYPGWPYLFGANYSTGGYTSLSAADINNDGRKEIVCIMVNTTTQRGELFIFNGNGTLYNANYPAPLAGSTRNQYGGPVVADIDNDLQYEIGYVGSYGTCIYNDGSICWVKINGTQLVAGWPASFNQQFMCNSLTVGDIDRDGTLETVFGTVGNPSVCNQVYQVYVFKSNGTRLPGWPQNIFGQIYSQPTLADVNGDGYAEVLAVTSAGFVYAWKYDGTLAPDFPKRMGAAGVYPWASSGVGAYDIDGDGKIEIVAGETSMGSNRRIFVWDCQGSAANSIEWPMFHYDAMNTNTVPKPLMLSFKYVGAIKAGLAQNGNLYLAGDAQTGTLSGLTIKFANQAGASFTTDGYLKMTQSLQQNMRDWLAVPTNLSGGVLVKYNVDPANHVSSTGTVRTAGVKCGFSF